MPGISSMMLPMPIRSACTPSPSRTLSWASRPPTLEQSRPVTRALWALRRSADSNSFSRMPISAEASMSRRLPPKKMEKEPEISA